jgi:hypothetical protein
MDTATAIEINDGSFGVCPVCYSLIKKETLECHVEAHFEQDRRRELSENEVLANETSDAMLARALHEEEKRERRRQKEKDEEFPRLQVLLMITIAPHEMYRKKMVCLFNTSSMHMEWIQHQVMLRNIWDHWRKMSPGINCQRLNIIQRKKNYSIHSCQEKKVEKHAPQVRIHFVSTFILSMECKGFFIFYQVLSITFNIKSKQDGQYPTTFSDYAALRIIFQAVMEIKTGVVAIGISRCYYLLYRNWNFIKAQFPKVVLVRICIVAEFVYTNSCNMVLK